MKFLAALAASALLFATSTLAGHNCKCQDPSGTGPQWDDATEQVCNWMYWEFCPTTYHGNQHHQCSTATSCLDSGEFVRLCQDAFGLPGAFCW